MVRDFEGYPLKPLISVCLPVFNGQSFVSAALDSILAQSEQNIEILVPDDCSTDRSFEIVENYARRDRRVKVWKNHHRLGLFANYNQCLRSSQGTYIKPMGQDDILAPSMLAESVERLSSNKDLVLVSTARKIVDADDKPFVMEGADDTPSTLLGRRNFYNKHEVWRACLMPMRNIIGEPCTVLFRANAAPEGFAEGLFHLGDLEFWLRLLRFGNYSYIPQALATFRRHDDSATTGNIKQLRIASDIIHCAKLLAPVIAECNYEEKDFILANLSCFATIICEQIKEGMFENEEILSSENLSRDEEIGLKKALLYSFMLIAENNGYQSFSVKTAGNIARCETSNRILLESFPWRATRPLREVKRLLASGGSCAKASHNGGAILKDQNQYLKLLREQRSQIVKSRSWKIGRSLQHILKPFYASGQ